MCCVPIQSEVTAVTCVCVCARVCVCLRTCARVCVFGGLCGFLNVIQAQLLSITLGLVQLELTPTGCVLLKPAQSGSNRLAPVFTSAGEMTYNHAGSI